MKRSGRVKYADPCPVSTYHFWTELKWPWRRLFLPQIQCKCGAGLPSFRQIAAKASRRP